MEAHVPAESVLSGHNSQRDILTLKREPPEEIVVPILASRWPSREAKQNQPPSEAESRSVVPF